MAALLTQKGGWRGSAGNMNVLAEGLDLLDLAGQLGGEGLLQRLQLMR